MKRERGNDISSNPDGVKKTKGEGTKMAEKKSSRIVLFGQGT